MKCPTCRTENAPGSKFCRECATPIPAAPEDRARVRDPQPPDPQESGRPAFTETLETSSEELTTGSTFAGRYQVIEELGAGGMGRVYKVRDTKINEKIALKLLRPEAGLDRKSLERFSNELKLARKIRHKNVCQMFDLGEDRGTLYITMEYVRGEDLRQLIRKFGRLSPGQAVSIARQICDGLEEAHKLGVVHRDLKPQNIMIDEEGHARIMDFGIARSPAGERLTGAGAFIGTPEYMSPEQVEGKDVDARSDIYALGVILYEMAAGRRPFDGETALSIAHKHKYEIPEDPRTFVAEFPDSLAGLILRCLDKDKASRYESAAALRADLVAFEQGLPTTEAVAPKGRPRTSKQVTVTFDVRKALVPALAGVLFVAAALVLWLVVLKKHVAPPPASGKPMLAILYFKNSTGDPDLDIWRSALPELLIHYLHQSRYIDVASDSQIYGVLRELNLTSAEGYAPEDLKRVAEKTRATHILQGNLTRSGTSFRFNTTLGEMSSGKVLASDMVQGEGESSFHAMVDELGGKIKMGLRLTSQEIASDIDREVGTITSESPEAFRYYSEARKYHLRSEPQEAIQLYQKAIAIDPEFAMAYRGMAAAYESLWDWEKSLESSQKALELSHRISERERHLIEGQFYYRSEKTYGQAIESFNKLLAFYPDDVIANNYLGLLYSGLEEWDQAIGKFEKAVSLQKDVLNCENLAWAYRNKGLYAEARRVWEDYLQTNPATAKVHVNLGRHYLHQGRLDSALKEADEAFWLDPKHSEISFLRGDVYHLKGEFDRSETEYLKLLEAGDRSAHLEPRMRLAALYLTQGKIEEGKKEIERAMALADELGRKTIKLQFHSHLGYMIAVKDPREALKEIDKARMGFEEEEFILWEIYALALKGICQVRLGSIPEARKIATELKERIDGGLFRKAVRYHHILEGAIALEMKDFPGAVERSYRVVDLLPFQATFLSKMSGLRQAFYMELLAAAYFMSGDREDARRVYERITSLTSGRMHYGDIYARSFYMLGKIHEQKGERSAAVEYYEKFLAIWKDADPDLPEPADAKTRLARLKARP